MSVEQPPAFGALLRRYRVAAQWSQEALAERAGLSARTVSDLERGEKQAPHRDTVRLLAVALALSAEESTALEAAIPRRRRLCMDAASSAQDGARSRPLALPLVGRGRSGPPPAWALVRPRIATSVWPFTALVGAAPLVSYRVSRTTGLPRATDDVGNWFEPLGVVAIVAELRILAVAAACCESETAPGRSCNIRRRCHTKQVHHETADASIQPGASVLACGGIAAG